MYEPRTFTIPELVERSSATYKGRPALAMIGGKPVMYEELEPLSRRRAALLGLLGIEKGDRVALVSENRPEWGLSYFGISRAGAIAVPILTDFTAEQMGNILAHAEAKAVIVSKKFLPKLEGERGKRLILDVEDLGIIATASSGAPSYPSEAEIDAAAAAFSPPPVGEDELASIVYTSGTTGLSKGVMLTHKNLVWDAYACRSIIVLRRRDRLLSILPLAHAYEFTIGFLIPMMQGSGIWYLDRPPSATALLPALKAVRPTIMLSVPLVIEKVYRASVIPGLEKIGLYKVKAFKPLLERLAGAKLYKTFGGKLRFFGVGGAPLAADVEAFLRRARFPFAIGYGLTETAPMVAGFHPFRGAPRSTGPAMRGVELRIADPRPDSGEGEIQVRGPNVFPGYYKDPVRTAEAFTQDGWFRTGDLGFVDERGMVHVRGRLKTMILGASGENIYPEEVEAVLNRSPYVAESLVYGDEGGLTALVQLKPEILEELSAGVHDGLERAEIAAEKFGHAVGEAIRHALERIEGGHRALPAGGIPQTGADERESGRIEKAAKSVELAVGHLLDRIKKEANEKLAAFSRVQKVERQDEPFEKTPTQKIKRFLYPKK